MAADDVVAGVATIAVGSPVNGVIEFAGPEQFRLEEIVRRELHIRRDSREVVRDPLPGPDATIAPTRFDDWLAAGRLTQHS